MRHREGNPPRIAFRGTRPAAIVEGEAISGNDKATRPGRRRCRLADDGNRRRSQEESRTLFRKAIIVS